MKGGYIVELTAKFICAKPYKFERDGAVYSGVTVYLLTNDLNIIKAKATTNEYTKYKMGDTVPVGVTFYADRVKYEV